MTEKASPDPVFEALLHHIQESRGLDFRGYKRTSLRRRITLRMEAVGAADFGAYQSQLEADPGEFESLLNTVLINVTSFFRDEEAWEVLKTQVVPSIIARAGEYLHEHGLGDGEGGVGGDQLSHPPIHGTARRPIELHPGRGVCKDHAAPRGARSSGTSSIARAPRMDNASSRLIG